MIDVDELRERVVGRELGTGTYTVAAHEAWLAHDVLASPRLPDDELHPVHVFIGGAVGAGHTIQDVFDLVECRAEDGPMLGETDLRQRRALRVGETLVLRARILDLQRKQGRSGTFDLMQVETTFTDADGDVAATLRNSFVYPRRA